MALFTDQLGTTITVPDPPQRIISLVPSQSELLWDMGLQKELVGITRFCIHPQEMFKSVDRVGGTKKLNLEKIISLQPDLIIGNKEENDLEQIRALQSQFPVWMSEVITIEDALAMINSIGQVCARTSQAKGLSEKISTSLSDIKGLFSGKRVAYFMWNEPYMVAASGTFIHSVLDHLGMVNVAQHLQRYPQVTVEELRAMRPDLCLLSTEPFPFKESQAQSLQQQLGIPAKVVDGEMFSWYGSRMLRLKEYAGSLEI